MKAILIADDGTVLEAIQLMDVKDVRADFRVFCEESAELDSDGDAVHLSSYGIHTTLRKAIDKGF